MFDWDEANEGRIWERHAVSAAEAEGALLDPGAVFVGANRSGEQRASLIGRTEQGRVLRIFSAVESDARSNCEGRERMGTKAPPKTAKVVRQGLVQVNSTTEIPEFATEEEFRNFWDTHGLGPGWKDVSDVRDPRLPPARPRTTPVAVRFDADVVARLKAVAAKKHKGYQTLLKEFVSERLYEEEKREGLIQGS